MFAHPVAHPALSLPRGGVARWAYQTTFAHTGTQEPGDIIYVPAGWGHAVLNLEDTVAVATEIRPN